MEKEEIQALLKEAYKAGVNETHLQNIANNLQKHTEKDDEQIGNLYDLVREMPDKLWTKVEKYMKENYTSKTEFQVFTTKVGWSVIAGMTVATTVSGVILWLITTFAAKP